jgi:hypothetical protein
MGRRGAPLRKEEVIALPFVGNPSRLGRLIGVSRQAIDAWPAVLKPRQEEEVVGMLLREDRKLPVGWIARLRLSPPDARAENELVGALVRAGHEVPSDRLAHMRKHRRGDDVARVVD